MNTYIHKYYNTRRTHHQGIGGKTPIPLPEYPPTTMANTKLKKTTVLGSSLLFHELKSNITINSHIFHFCEWIYRQLFFWAFSIYPRRFLPLTMLSINYIIIQILKQVLSNSFINIKFFINLYLKQKSLIISFLYYFSQKNISSYFLHIFFIFL